MGKVEDAARERTRQALARSLERQRQHPSIPLMPEDVRGLTEAFGLTFRLWPPSSNSKQARRMRGRWAEWLRECCRTLDGEPLDPRPYWSEIAGEGRFLVSSPASTIKTVRAKHAVEQRWTTTMPPGAESGPRSPSGQE